MKGTQTLNRWTLTAVLTAMLALAAPAPGTAQQHRARLSKDVAFELAAPSSTLMQVIVESRAKAQDLVARYGLRVKKQLANGVALEGTPGQVEALANDPDVDQISGNNKVKGDAS
ncbi:MAG: hypothetical protein NT151_08895, partial [Acidobacteria bacterium]|nr:hypothetical protein [Acidobacteriota bacterium]